MRNLTFTASDGEALHGHLPDSWAEVPLAPYVALALTIRALPEGTESTAHLFASDAGCVALAALLGLPTAEPLLTDRSLLLDLEAAAPWLLLGPLPTGEPAAHFTHLGTTYAYGGGLDNVTGEEWEALELFLRESGDAPLACAPYLLAILYRSPQQPARTAASVKATAAAFATLPLSLAWPAIQAFFVRALPLATPIQKYFAARPLVGQAVRALEQALMTSAPPAYSWNMGRWLAKTWLKLARRQLTTFLPPSATTAAPRSWRKLRKAK